MKRALLVLALCVAFSLLQAQALVLRAAVLDCGGARIAGSDCIARLSLGQTIASGPVRSAWYSGVLGFWHPPYARPGIQETGVLSAAAAEVRLSAPSPNPVVRSCVIRYSIPLQAVVRLSVLDRSGRVVGFLVNCCQTPGSYRVFWSAAGAARPGLASGIYFLRLEAAGERRIQKLVLAR